MSPRSDGDGRLVHIGDVLGPALERLGPKTLWMDARLRKVWPSVIGPDLVAHVRPGRLRGTTLVVQVSSDVWATELRYLSAIVIEKLNARLGDGTVTEIDIAKRRFERPF